MTAWVTVGELTEQLAGLNPATPVAVADDELASGYRYIRRADRPQGATRGVAGYGALTLQVGDVLDGRDSGLYCEQPGSEVRGHYRNDTMAANIKRVTAYRLEWTDYVANTWEETFPSERMATMRLAKLIEAVADDRLFDETLDEFIERESRNE